MKNHINIPQPSDNGRLYSVALDSSPLSDLIRFAIEKNNCHSANHSGLFGAYTVISNTRFLTNLDWNRLQKQLAKCHADIITVTVDNKLRGFHEQMRLGSNSKVAGFRRFYDNTPLPAKMPAHWPHHILVRPKLFEKILLNDSLPPDFTKFVTDCESKGLVFYNIKIGAGLVDLQTETGLLTLASENLPIIPVVKKYTKAKIFGTVFAGKNVHIHDSALIVGPTILCDNVKVLSDAVINASIIAPHLTIDKGICVHNRVVIETNRQSCESAQARNIVEKTACTISAPVKINHQKNNFRHWPKFSYPRCLKRIADIFFASAVLILFLPFFPLIALAVKLNSPGPVFFRHKRQGIYGREFFCLKFRTMLADADKIQHKLRFKNQVDGPQFKIDDDPRITLVGSFLRETFIDEIPQFINILFGQMSVVGPRPSPESENSQCPFWRDARLSVRPGITGLWQLRRTRSRGRDFQEWIHYDTEYIRNLSPRLDFLICCQTAKKLVMNFIDQF